MRVLGIDLGKSRTGLAISDEKERIAFPLEVISEKSEEKIISRVLKAIDEHDIKKVVIGLPKSMDGTEGKGSEFSRKFSRTIKNKKPGLNIFMQDERCTTITANRYLSETKLKNKKKRSIIDAVAATVILQSFLNGI